MLTPLQILALLAVHFVADFLFQSDWMALNKGKRWDALALHCALYAVCFVPFGLAFAALTFVAHFAQDAVTSRINSRFWFFDMAMPVLWPSRRDPNGPAVPHYAARGGDRHWFFVGIGADQLLHFTQLILLAQALVR